MQYLSSNAIALYRVQIKRLLGLAAPIFLAQLAQSSMSLVDTIMAGRVSALDMAAIAVGASIYLPLVLFGNGLLLALPPVVSYLNGSGQRHKIAHQIRQGLWLVLACSLVLGTMVYFSYFILDYMDLTPELADISRGYLQAISWGIPGYLLMINFRGLNDGIAKTKPAMVVAFVGLLLNIPLNYIFIYGHFGLPAYGAVGCGIATSLVDWVMGFMMIAYCRNAPSQRDLNVFQHLFEKPNWHTLHQLTKLGLPIALAICSEVMLFAVSSLLLAPLGTNVVASHQIALNISSVLFIFPLSLGMATTIVIGQRLGEKRFAVAKELSYLTLTFGLIMAVCLASIILLFRTDLASVFVTNKDVVAMAASLLVLTAIYQFSDTTQVLTSGILRGYKDTKSILFITLFCYWLIGIPLGYVLSRTDWIVAPLGAAGFWTAFVVSLTVAAILLFRRLRKIQSLPEDQLLAKVEVH